MEAHFLPRLCRFAISTYGGQPTQASQVTNEMRTNEREEK